MSEKGYCARSARSRARVVRPHARARAKGMLVDVGGEAR